jgi:hypothetical protein
METSKTEQHGEAISNWPFWLALDISLWFAFLTRFVQDDGLIYFRYALNFAEGRGLVWNPGELIDGYLNLLWILLLGTGLKAGIGLVEFSYMCGLLFFSITIFYTYRSIILISDAAWFNFLLLLFMGSNFSFVTCATGGLDTHMQLCLLMASTYYFLKTVIGDDYSFLNLFRLSCLLGIAFITRMDSAVLVICILPATAWFVITAPKDMPRFKLLVVLTMPSALLAMGYLAFRLLYFGDIFPNVYYAKAGVKTVLFRGINYIYCFYHNYMLEAILVASAAAFVAILRQRRNHSKAFIGSFMVIGLFFVLWNGYVIKVNGDYMEFRLMVPGVPFLVLLFCYSYKTVFKYKSFLMALLIFLCLNNLKIFYINQWIDDLERYRRFAAIHYPMPTAVESVRSLIDNLWDENKNWVGVGKALGQVFNYSQEIKIAVIPAGAIPFYSRLPTLDMLGLNDRWVARNGIPWSTFPGHSRMAPPEYMLSSNVNLIVALPYLVNRDDTSKAVQDLKAEDFEMRTELLPEQSRFLCIPVNKVKSVVVLYLQRHPVIDAAIEENHLQVFEINRKKSSKQSGKDFWFQ